MKTQFSVKSEQMLREMTLKRIKDVRSNFSNKCLHVDGRYYKIAVVISYITAVYNFVVFLAQLLGAYFLTLDTKSEEFLEFWQNNLYNFIIASIIMLGALIALFIKKRLAYSAFTIIFTLFYFINSSFLEYYIQQNQIDRLYIFLPTIILMTLCAIYMIITHITDLIEYKHAYNKLVDKIIATHPAKAGEITSEAQWEEYIKEYSEPAVHAKPKKSLRNKKRKDTGEVKND